MYKITFECKKIQNVKANGSYFSTVDDFSRLITQHKCSDIFSKYEIKFKSGLKILAPSCEINVISCDKIDNVQFTCKKIAFKNPIHISNNSIMHGCNYLDLRNVIFSDNNARAYFLASVRDVKFDKNSNFVSCNLKQFNSMFYNFKGSHIPNFITFSKDTINANNMFCKSNLKCLPKHFKFNKNIVYINQIFGNMKHLETVPNFETISKRRYPNLVMPAKMFYGCKKLKNLNIKFYKKDIDRKRYLKHSSNFYALFSIIREL